MKVEFTKKEYEALLDLVQIATWIIESQKEKEDPKTKKYRDLEQKVLSLAGEAGLGDLVVHEPKADRYFMENDVDMDNPAMTFVREYEIESFWNELVDQLILRDLVEVHGEEQVSKMDPRKRFELSGPLESKYEDDFSENGINNLRLVK